MAVALFNIAATYPAASPPAYGLIDIGDFGYGYTQPERINGVGAVVGESLISSSRGRAFVFTNQSGLVALAPFNPSDQNGTAFDINERGDACGVSGVHAVIWYAGGRLRDLGDLGFHGFTSYCYGINNLGHAVGFTWSDSRRAPMFFWSARTGMVDLGAAGVAYAINDFDEVTGQSSRQAFIWRHGAGIRDIGTLPGGEWSVGLSINNWGWVAGVSDVAPDRSHAFLWTRSGGMRDLGTLGGVYSHATTVTAWGTVYGWSTTSTGAVHAFVWDFTHGMRDLNLPLPAGWQMEGALTTPAANNARQVVIYALQAATGRQHAFLAQPVGA